MSTSMKLDILTPVGPVAEGLTVPGVEVPGLLGELGILPDHESFVTAVVPGVVRYRDGAKSVRLAVGAGFVEVKDGGRVVLLCERALSSDDVDKSAAKERLSEVKRNLDKHPGPVWNAEYRDLQTEEAWLQAQIAV